MGTTLILDFDGTIALADIGDVLCDRFAPPEWLEIDAAWERGELSLPEAQRRMWGLVRTSPAAFDAAIDELGTIRPGFDELLERASEHGVRLVIASGGFDYYIQRMLGPALDRFESVWCNRLAVGEAGVEIGFPHLTELGCDSCAVCKGRVCDRYRALGDQVVFVGDGSSDRCAAGRADRLFCIAGSKLERICAEAGAPTTSIERLDQVSW